MAIVQRCNARQVTVAVLVSAGRFRRSRGGQASFRASTPASAAASRSSSRARDRIPSRPIRCRPDKLAKAIALNRIRDHAGYRWARFGAWWCLCWSACIRDWLRV